VRHVDKDGHDHSTDPESKSATAAAASTTTFVSLDAARLGYVVSEHQQASRSARVRSPDVNVYSAVSERIQQFPLDRFEPGG
jgi:precorrin-4 methylase